MTESNILKNCCICGSGNNVEMHHIRKVAEVRNKVRTGNATYAINEGVFKKNKQKKKASTTMSISSYLTT